MRFPLFESSILLEDGYFRDREHMISFADKIDALPEEVHKALPEDLRAQYPPDKLRAIVGAVMEKGIRRPKYKGGQKTDQKILMKMSPEVLMQAARKAGRRSTKQLGATKQELGAKQQELDKTQQELGTSRQETEMLSKMLDQAMQKLGAANLEISGLRAAIEEKAKDVQELMRKNDLQAVSLSDLLAEKSKLEKRGQQLSDSRRELYNAVVMLRKDMDDIEEFLKKQKAEIKELESKGARESDKWKQLVRAYNDQAKELKAQQAELKQAGIEIGRQKAKVASSEDAKAAMKFMTELARADLVNGKVIGRFVGKDLDIAKAREVANQAGVPENVATAVIRALQSHSTRQKSAVSQVASGMKRGNDEANWEAALDQMEDDLIKGYRQALAEQGIEL